MQSMHCIMHSMTKNEYALPCPMKLFNSQEIDVSNIIYINNFKMLFCLLDGELQMSLLLSQM